MSADHADAIDRVPGPGEHGGDAAQIAEALGLDPDSMIDLSASLNPFAPDVAALVATLARDGHIITAYPDPSKGEAALATAIGVDPDRLVLTNGAAEAIALLAAELGAGWIEEPEFSLYRRHLGAITRDAPRWRANPSTPHGGLAGSDEHSSVWDEAFYPLATGSWTRGDDASWRLGSLTKLWSCPGLRLGYVIAPTSTAAEAIRARRPAWSVNGLALGVIEPLLEQTELEFWTKHIEGARSELTVALRGEGYQVADTAANWVLVRGDDLRARLAPSGVVVRDCTSFGMPGWVRVAVPRPDQHDRVVSAFAAANPDR